MLGTLHCCDKMPKEINLKEEKLLLTDTRGLRPWPVKSTRKVILWQQDYGAEGSLHFMGNRRLRGVSKGKGKERLGTSHILKAPTDLLFRLGPTS